MTLQQKLGVRVFNRLGSGLGWLVPGVSGFDVGQMETQARQKTGCNDFGDPQYREPLQRLCESYQSDRELTFIGQMVCRGSLMNNLTNRLRIQHELATHPQVVEQPVSRPLMVMGLPRTGTTLLYGLLSQDTFSRPLLFWESMQPAPSPTPETRTTDPRIRQAEKTLGSLNSALPELKTIHEFRHDGPEECLGLLMNSFLTPFFRGRIPLYREWLDTVSPAYVDQAYREYRSQLQILQRHIAGERWLLKCPSHLWGLSGLMNAIPDACIIQTHRQLGESLPSLCSLTATVEQLCYEKIDLQDVGRRGLHIAEQLLTRGMQARDTHPDATVQDVMYQDLIADPIATVRVIYERFGFPYTDEFEQRMRTYMEQSRKTRHAKHAYSLEQFGLSSGLLQQKFADYNARYGL